MLVSDIHLPGGPSAYRDGLLALLEDVDADAIYLLGDIFEYWLGDDVSGAEHAPVLAALRRRAEGGTRIHFMAGNRDFLVSPALLASNGVTMLPDPAVVMLPDGPALLSHGDQWCTQDHAYQRWRRFAHYPAARRGFLALPRSIRRAIAHRLRAGRARATEADILDVADAAIDSAFRENGIQRIIHGHTHRPAHHRHAGGDRFVLPDWRPDDHRYLLATSTGLAEFRLE
ncbi:UDP-2,3-diacylglucosamine diphosphatase [Algiphilus sp.]|uniref:UDP-2,3-diacylglucosamine diphosphatase n=1 Tax=Algiphilus sp. TaxID=1872431 RepID=UPI0025C45BB7|nr:UDP-2,3-diacylglucosamine diphosphatase [Algiphilus sp.]MCK5770253.1 UDP-2,3-diacylglucosamine diphosphatase [Algiphilus sp.]